MTNFKRMAHSCTEAAFGVQQNSFEEIGYNNNICPYDPDGSGQANRNKPLNVFLLWHDSNGPSGSTISACDNLYFPAYQDNTTFVSPSPAQQAWERFCNFTPANNSCPANWAVYIINNTRAIQVYNPNGCAEPEVDRCSEASCDPLANHIRDCNGNCVPQSWLNDGFCHDGSAVSQNLTAEGLYGNLKCERWACSNGNCTCDECCGCISGTYETGLLEAICDDNVSWDEGLCSDRSWNQACPSCTNLNDVKFIWGPGCGGVLNCNGWAACEEDWFKDKIADDIYEDIVTNKLNASLPVTGDGEDPPWTEGQVRIFNIVDCTSSMSLDWDDEPYSILFRLKNNLSHNGVDGVYTKDSTNRYLHIAGVVQDETGIATLTNYMAEAMPSIVGDGKQSVAPSTAINHIIVIPVDCGCIDSGITSGQYFGDIAESNTHFTDYAATTGGKILVVLITECGQSGVGCGNDVCCGCESTPTGAALLTCGDGSTARDGNLPTTASSTNIKVLFDAESSDNCGCAGTSYYSGSSCTTDDNVADFSDLDEYDLSDGAEWPCFQACAYRVIDEWLKANFTSGTPQPQSTMVHAMGGCKGGDYGHSNQTKLTFAWIVKQWADNFLGAANGGNGMSWDYDSFSYPQANWIDMMNLALRNITGHGELA
tara:strand:- start:8893 stop:10851 length:1959 start_codon:yes stop_codon:yes gene_type:complete